jgi:hypothetical protein
MTHPDPFTSNTAFEEVMSEISKADEGGGPEMHGKIEVLDVISPRDFFAAHAIAECLRTRGLSDRDAALSAYAIADAMLEARKVKT